MMSEREYLEGHYDPDVLAALEDPLIPMPEEAPMKKPSRQRTAAQLATIKRRYRKAVEDVLADLDTEVTLDRNFALNVLAAVEIAAWQSAMIERHGVVLGGKSLVADAETVRKAFYNPADVISK